jgi:predicted nucleic acid-binding protein
VIVLDANVLVYVLIPGEHHAAAMRVLDRDRACVAPPLWRSEIRNVFATYMRSGRLRLEDALVLMDKAEGIMSIAAARPASSTAVLRLASQSGCSGYDCEYVALAQLLKVPLVTGDGKVLRAFPDVAMSMEAFASGEDDTSEA